MNHNETDSPTQDANTPDATASGTQNNLLIRIRVLLIFRHRLRNTLPEPRLYYTLFLLNAATGCDWREPVGEFFDLSIFRFAIVLWWFGDCGDCGRGGIL